MFLLVEPELEMAIVMLVSAVPMVLSQSAKLALLRKEIFQLGAFNKFTSITTFVWGAAAFPLVLAVMPEFDSISQGILD